MDCVEIVNIKTQSDADFLQEIIRIGTETPPPTVVLPWSCDTK